MSKRASVVLLIVSLAIVSLIQGAARAEPRVELEAFLGGGLNGSMGGGGRVGVPVGQHLVLMTGLEGQGSGGEEVLTYWVRIPAELKVYLTPPRPGRLSPQLRLGAAYVRTGMEWNGSESTSVGIEGLGGLGLSYLVSEHLGLGVDAGLTYGRYSQDNGSVGVLGGVGGAGEGWQLGISWRLGLVFRI
jgi:hypothetical protein